MTIVISVNGNSSGEGFLIAPVGSNTFQVPLGLKTDDGSSIDATLQVAPGGAGVALDQTTITITPMEKFVNIHATSPSSARNDTLLQVLVAGIVQASFNLTSIINPEIWFRGRFQARFATDLDYYNEKRGSTAGWNIALEAEPDFVPVDSVATDINKPVGREVRFNNPVALRTHVPPIGVNVSSIKGGAGTNTEEFTVGDPIIGQQVDLGPHTYLAGNDPVNPIELPPAEMTVAGLEPMAIFEFHIANALSGKAQVPGDRPVGGGAVPLSAAEKTQYGIITQATFDAARKAELLADYTALTPVDRTGTSAGRNLATRIAHLGGDTGMGILPLKSTLAAGWVYKQEFSGLVNDSITFHPFESGVLSYFAGFNSFNFFARMFNYHSDEQCGQVHGSASVDLTTGIPPFQNGIYNIQSLVAGGFHGLSPAEMTVAQIDSLLGASPTSERAVVTVSASYSRLVISKAVIANPGDPPASWTISSRGESFIGLFIPEASVYPRDLVYRILSPHDERNVLGACEGTLFSSPAPTQGFARLFPDGAVWKMVLHTGVEGDIGVTYKGEWVSPPTIPTGCTPPDVEVLTPLIDFGTIDQGMVLYREIVLLNRTSLPVEISLPPIPAPFGIAGLAQTTIPGGTTGVLQVSFTAGTPGTVPPSSITLASNPLTATSLIVSLTGISVAVATIDAVLVLDRSGSMAEAALTGPRGFVTKTSLRNQASQMLVDLLRPGDRIGMVRFDDTAQIHMALEIAGDAPGGTGRVDAATALSSADLLPGGSTSIGDGMIHANTMLTGPSSATRKAMVVLTDGVENTPPWITDVVLGPGIRAYAVGLGLPENIDVDKLSSITGNTGGYLLVTGALDEANEFRLHKYFVQILAGISNDSIVVDPRSVITPGETQRTPFYVTEGDTQFDVVLLTHFPVLRFSLEAPDGTLITSDNVTSFNGQYIVGRACVYYRMQLPTFAFNLERSMGRWNIVVDYPGKRQFRMDSLVPQKPRNKIQDLVRTFDDQKMNRQELLAAIAFNAGRPYNVLVRARSSISLYAFLARSQNEAQTVVAYLSAFGQPLEENVKLVSYVTRPDGVSFILPMKHVCKGCFEATLDDTRQLGHYYIVVRALGLTPGSWPLQREQTLSGIILDPASKERTNPQLHDILNTLKAELVELKKLNKAVDHLVCAEEEEKSRKTRKKRDKDNSDSDQTL